MALLKKKLSMPEAFEALPGRAEAMPVVNRHFVNGNPIWAPFPRDKKFNRRR